MNLLTNFAMLSRTSRTGTLPLPGNATVRFEPRCCPCFKRS
jgi:hypothetical protein